MSAKDAAEPPEFVSVSHVANRLAVSTQAVRGWIKDGSIRGIRVGGLWRVPRQDLERLLGQLDDHAENLGAWDERARRRSLVDPEEASEG